MAFTGSLTASTATYEGVYGYIDTIESRSNSTITSDNTVENNYQYRIQANFYGNEASFSNDQLLITEEIEITTGSEQNNWTDNSNAEPVIVTYDPYINLTIIS